MLRVTDISNHQRPDINLYPGDAYIFKATEGTGFVDRNCDIYVQQVKATGKPWGVYHFLNGENWKAQADHFLNSIQGYIGEALLVLDYEMYGRQGAGVAKAWLDYVSERAGYKPLIYMNASDAAGDDWSQVVAGDYGLWLAGYPHNDGRDEPLENMPGQPYWPFVAMWQYTSVPYDKSYFFGDESTWRAYTGRGKKEQAPEEVDVDFWAEITSGGYSLDTRPWVEDHETIMWDVKDYISEVVKVTKKKGGYYEVELPDGTRGWLDHRALEKKERWIEHGFSQGQLVMLNKGATHWWGIKYPDQEWSRDGDNMSIDPALHDRLFCLEWVSPDDNSLWLGLIGKNGQVGTARYQCAPWDIRHASEDDIKADGRLAEGEFVLEGKRYIIKEK